MNGKRSGMNTNTEVFETMRVPKAVRTMAIPTVIGQLIVLIYNIADTYFIGRTGNPHMVAAASLILPIFNISLALASLTGVGGGSLVSRLLGEKELPEARRVFSFCFWLTLLESALFSALTLAFMRPLMKLLGAGPDTFDFARSYALCVIVCGGIPTVLSNTLSSFLRSVGESRRAGIGITMGGVINILLDPLFMFVLLPDGMEIIGAGVATCLSNCIACTYFLITIARQRDGVLRVCSPKDLPAGRSLRSVFGVGVPTAIVMFLFDLDYIVIDRLMSGYGDLALAAIGITLKAERLPLNVGVGLCQGMTPLVAYNYSSKNYSRMDAIKRHTLMLGLVCAAVSIVLYELFAGPIERFFLNDAETVALGAGFLRVRCLATPLMFLSFFHVHMFNGFGEGGHALFLGAMRWLGFNIPMLFLLNRLLGIRGIVWAQFVGDCLTVGLSLLVYRRYARKHFVRIG